MPRRRYGSVEELRGAVAVAMERLREGVGQGCRIHLATTATRLSYPTFKPDFKPKPFPSPVIMEFQDGALFQPPRGESARWEGP
jgi:hypothetical protein